MKYRIMVALTVLCLAFSMASCKKNQNTDNNNNTHSESVATTLDEGPAAEGTTEFKPLEVQENATVELPEDGTFTSH